MSLSLSLCRVLFLSLCVLALSCESTLAQDNIDITGSTFPATISATGIAQVNIKYTSTDSRTIVVDVLNTPAYSWFGKGTANVGAGSGTASISITIQNNPPAGTNYMFNVFIVAAGDFTADPANAYMKALQPAKSMAVTVGGTGTNTGGGGATPGTPTTTLGKYDYATVTSFSIKFYEAQRSGKLVNNRIPFRGDSALGDKGTNGEDLTGGYYDAGDHVKFNFPAAYAMTTLAWGIIAYKQGYVALNEYQNALNGLQWGTDFLLKCHPDVNSHKLYAQVGDGDLDHAYWGRPEQMTMARPVTFIDDTKPGSDLAGEVAAAFAAASIVFKPSNPTYAATLIAHARTLYTFADTKRAKYSDSLPTGTTAGPNPFYTSSDFKDELVWAALWLYQATGETAFLTDAKAKYTQFQMQYQTFAFSWDSKGPGVNMLMAQILKNTPTDPIYVAALAATAQFVKDYSVGGVVPRTPKGLPVRLQWGSNRFATGAAWIALLYADSGLASQQDATNAVSMATGIINYVLGDSGRSLVVGYGNNPPTHCHHRAASCPNLPAACGQPQFTTTAPNPQTLFGAMVGGPKTADDGTYADARDDFTSNEVTLDYNAAFQNVVLRMSMLSATTTTTSTAPTTTTAPQATAAPTNGPTQGTTTTTKAPTTAVATTPSPISGATSPNTPTSTPTSSTCTSTPSPAVSGPTSSTPVSGTTPLPTQDPTLQTTLAPFPGDSTNGANAQANGQQGQAGAGAGTGKASATPIIIGSAVGGVAVLLVIIAICCYVRRQASVNSVTSTKMVAESAV